MNSKNKKIPVIFHKDQLDHNPAYEWSFGEKTSHPEATARMESIINALKVEEKNFCFITPKKIALKNIKNVHHPDLITLYKSAMDLPLGKIFYPTIFPQRTQIKPNPKNINHSGYFCYDAGTPLTANTWAAAAWSATSAVEAATLIENGSYKTVYSLCRPPGHHASERLFGGYCYFNNAAIAASLLGKKGKVVIVDIDFHHGNGTQSIFYNDRNVLFISIHGDPEKFYPFFTGYKNEKGFGDGSGFNINIPLQTGCDGDEYFNILKKLVIPEILKFAPSALVISAGFDTYMADPIGSFSLVTEDYFKIAEIFSQLNLPTVIMQEGGYDANSLGDNVRSFLDGFIRWP